MNLYVYIYIHVHIYIRIYTYMVQRRWAPTPPTHGIPPPVVWVGGVVEVLVVVVVVEVEVVV